MHDHRIAMAFAVLGALPGNCAGDRRPRRSVEISFPGFWETAPFADLPPDARPSEGGAAHQATPVTSRPDGIIIAIDGPAGSGKSSTARAVAAEMGYRHLDSGAFYRAITWAALRAGVEPERWPGLAAEDLHALAVDSSPPSGGTGSAWRAKGSPTEIRRPEVNAGVSTMAAVPAVRAWLLASLRRAGERGGLVADGRDIGTVVFPDAELKIFLVCAPEERARRRLAEQGRSAASEEEVAAEVARLTGRDEQDSSRAVAPLLRAPDAVLLDTTELSFPAQVRAIVRLAEDRIHT